MEAYIGRFGIWSPFVFIIYQIMQIVVIPFIPGGVTTTAGVVMFGSVEGLILNYIGICLGSIAAFALAKRYGRHLVLRFVDKKKYDRYEERLSRERSSRYFLQYVYFFRLLRMICFAFWQDLRRCHIRNS